MQSYLKCIPPTANFLEIIQMCFLTSHWRRFSITRPPQKKDNTAIRQVDVGFEPWQLAPDRAWLGPEPPGYDASYRNGGQLLSAQINPGTVQKALDISSTLLSSQ